MPQYKKVFDIGTYTGNGGQYRVGIPTLRGVGPSGKQAAGSLRFRNASSNDSKLSRTFSAGNQLKWTWSTWIKMGPLPNSTMLFNYNSGGGYSRSYHELTGNAIDLGDYSAGGSYIWHVVTTPVFKDPSIWYHLVVIYDSAQATAANRVKIYVNGSQITSFSTASYPSQNYSGYVNQSGSHVIGSIGYQTGYSFDGYMSEMYFLDGYANDSSSFGELNSDGIWVPKAYSGSYGTNGFYLPMNSSSNYATDQSGNGNNWTPNGFNIVTANTTYDLLTDSPTDYLSGSMTTANNAGNYATLNPNDSGGSTTFSDALLTISVPNTSAVASGSIRVSSGKWYWELTLTSSYTAPLSYAMAGIADATRATTSRNYTNANTWYYYTQGSYISGTSGTYGATLAVGDVVAVALDMDNGTITFYKNGVSQGVMASSGIKGLTVVPVFNNATSSGSWGGSVNFGQRAFAYTPPAGYNALNTYNITRPADSALWFYGDTPDLMWIKNRSTTGYHVLTDTVRGMGLAYVPHVNQVETSYPGVTEMNKFGMSIINDSTSILNGSTNSHVYWAWKAGSNTSSTSVTNTDGTITSQVSANRQAGFSIVTYTGTGANATVGHGLGVAPSMIFFYIRGRAPGGAPYHGVYHTSVGNTKILDLYSTATPYGAAAAYFNNTSPTSSVFSIGTDASTNDTNPMVAYCWAAIPGYSAFGSYTGNGSADGPFVYLGFRPRFILIKDISLGYGWAMRDTARDTYNPASTFMGPNVTTADTADAPIDILSNGFKIRASSTYTLVNNTNDTYIYAAFAEIPFKFARAR